MLVKNAEKKLLDAGAVDQSSDGYRRRFILGDRAITFLASSDGEIDCLAVCRINLESDRDLMTDYFPGVYVSNIKKAILLATN